MQKIKFNFSNITNILKCVLIGIVATLIGIVAFSVVLKFANISSKMISYINSIIKIFAIFIMITCVQNKSEGRVLFKAAVAGLLYAVLCFVIFSILNGSFVINMSLVFDIIFAVVVSVIMFVIITMIKHKSV